MADTTLIPLESGPWDSFGRKRNSNVFVGAHERQLDERGRVALPTSFRSTLGEQCYLTYGEDRCVRIMRSDVFQSEAEEMIAGVKAGLVSRAKQRAFSSSVVLAGLDKQGRLLIDQRLRDHAGIEPQSPVLLVGALDRIEIWDPERFAQQEELGRDELAGEQRDESELLGHGGTR